MVESRKLVYDFDRKFDNILSGQSVKIPLVDKIAYLNEFQQLLFNNCVRQAEVNQEAANYIRRFKEDRFSLNISAGNPVFARYPDNIHTRLNQLVIASKKDCCPDEKEIIINVLQSDDIHKARKNELRKSSFFFERCIGVTSAEGLSLYTDGEFNVEQVLIDYYRKPGEIHAPSYEKCNGEYYYLYNNNVIVEDTYCEFENHIDNLITDGAVLLASADKKDPGGFQLKLEKLLQSRNIYAVGVPNK